MTLDRPEFRNETIGAGAVTRIAVRYYIPRVHRIGAGETLRQFGWADDGDYASKKIAFAALTRWNAWREDVAVVMAEEFRTPSDVVAAGLALVAAHEIRHVALGLSYGIRTNRDWHLQGYDANGVARGALNPKPPDHASPAEFEVARNGQPKPQWFWTQEPKMVAAIKPRFIEAMLESVHLISEHWRSKLQPLREWESAKRHVKGDDRESVIASVQRYVDRALPRAEGVYQSSLIEYLHLSRELEVAFAGADTFAKVEAVCEKYVAGKFGIDWTLRGYFDPRFNFFDIQYLERRQLEVLRQNQLDRYGQPYSLFTADQIRPLLQRRPILAHVERQ